MYHLTTFGALGVPKKGQVWKTKNFLFSTPLYFCFPCITSTVPLKRCFPSRKYGGMTLFSELLKLKIRNYI